MIELLLNNYLPNEHISPVVDSSIIITFILYWEKGRLGIALTN